MKISAGRLREVLHYNPDTGLWTWLVSVNRGARAGSRAGTIIKGYLRIRIDGQGYQASCLAWFYMTGEWPIREVDHRDTDKANDRWINLREASSAENNSNRRMFKNNTSGFKGVSWDRKAQKWRVQIQRCGSKIFLGFRYTPEEGAALYALGSEQHHRQFGRVT
jgi:HNH endonuclease